MFDFDYPHKADLIKSCIALIIHEALRIQPSQGMVALAQAAIAAGVKRFVFVSTSNVYGAGYGHPAKEDDIVDINDPRAYSSSKIAAEQALLKLELDVRILRLGFVYGDQDPHI